MAQPESLDQLKMDPAALYREDTFTDRRIGTIRRLVPVDADGADDPSRQVIYSGHTQVMTPAGPLPLSFELEAGSLTEAAESFPEAAARALEETMEELKQMQREQSSSIMVPGRDGPGSAGGLGGAGGMGGLKL